MAEQFDLNVVHPEYARHFLRWKMQWDFYRGGIHVLDPDGARLRTVFFLEPRDSSEGVSPDGRDTGTIYQWTPQKTNSYLLTHERESLRRWQDRGSRAYHIPLTRPIVDIFVSGILRNAPKRESSEGRVIGPLWQSYIDDVDFGGTNMDRFIRNAATLASNFGKVFAVTDRARVNDVPSSAFEAAERGIRAYSYLVSPMDVPNWSLDSFGNFKWVQIREPAPDTFLPGKERDTVLYQHRIWYTDHWQLYRESNGSTPGAESSFELVDEGEHSLGRVPVSVLYCKKARDVSYSLEAEGIANDLVDIDRSIYNKCSLLDEIDYGQTFSQLAVPNTRSVGLTPIEAGVYSAIAFDPDGGPPVYVSPNPAMADGLWSRIESQFEAARVALGVSRGSAEQSKEARSGVGITLESEEKFNMMSSIVSNVESFEKDLYKTFGAWEETADAPRIEYKRNFHLQSLETEIRNALAIQKSNVGAKAMVPLQKTLMTKQLKEMGVDESVAEQARQEIEKNAKEVEKAAKEAKAVGTPDNRFNKSEVGRASIDEVSEIQPK